MMRNLHYLLLLILLILPFCSYSQKERSIIREGNEHYENKDYLQAEQLYARAYKTNKESFEAAFNLGTSLYKQGKYKEAARQFERLTTLAVGKEQRAMIFHNFGNALLKSEMILESVNAYKMALKQDPEAHDTRYNLMYALSLLENSSAEPQSIPEETQQILQKIEEAEKAVKRKMREAKTPVPKSRKDW
jgi:tetratricopeptide (TPR) repeat protein